jgi:hypothetical protein
MVEFLIICGEENGMEAMETDEVEREKSSAEVSMAEKWMKNR